jgi:hypothetical protein
MMALSKDQTRQTACNDKVSTKESVPALSTAGHDVYKSPKCERKFHNNGQKANIIIRHAFKSRSIRYPDTCPIA